MLSTWNKALILALLLLSASAEAQNPGGSEGSWQHADGLWLGWQRLRSQEAEHAFYLVDTGNVELARSVPERRQVARLNWTLGLGERLDRFVILEGQTIWERSFGQHRFSLGLDAGASIFYGSTRFTNLEDQFILSNGLNLGSGPGTTDRLATGLTLSDTITLTRTLELTLDGSRQEARTRIAGEEQSGSIVDSWGARIEKRWPIARFQASARKTELEQENDLTLQNLDARQSVLDMQARLLVPIKGRLNGSMGWQDLSMQGSNADARRLSGPELGLAYTPESAWSANILARSLREQGSEVDEGQLFGEANVGFRGDARHSFLFGLSKEIDLISSFRVFTVQNIAATDQQRSTVSAQGQWSYQRGRYRSTLSLLQSRQDFTQSEGDFTEINLSQFYDVTRRGQLSAVLSGRSTRFETDVPPVSIKRNFADLRVGWQEVLTGGLRPLGGRIFYRLDLGYENLQEEIAELSAERLTLLVSLGQLGNF